LTGNDETRDFIQTLSAAKSWNLTMLDLPERGLHDFLAGDPSSFSSCDILLLDATIHHLAEAFQGGDEVMKEASKLHSLISTVVSAAFRAHRGSGTPCSGPMIYFIGAPNTQAEALLQYFPVEWDAIPYSCGFKRGLFTTSKDVHRHPGTAKAATNLDEHWNAALRVSNRFDTGLASTAGPIEVGSAFDLKRTLLLGKLDELEQIVFHKDYFKALSQVELAEITQRFVPVFANVLFFVLRRRTWWRLKRTAAEEEWKWWLESKAP
jgi:hypothetical protein